MNLFIPALLSALSTTGASGAADPEITSLVTAVLTGLMAAGALGSRVKRRFSKNAR